jgi:hypothetical protein
MAIPTYTTRITNDGGKITAWVDKDGLLCIEQPNAPEKLSSGDTWASVEEAQAWADEHAALLTQLAVDAEAESMAKAEKEALENAARQAILDNAAKVDEIHAMLTALTSKE